MTIHFLHTYSYCNIFNELINVEHKNVIIDAKKSQNGMMEQERSRNVMM